jgi:uncharacterized protein (TIGR02466 family)
VSELDSSQPHYFLQSPGDLHERPEFLEIVSAIELEAEKFWSQIGYKTRKMKVMQLWANRMKGRGFINDHFHSNSLISAIFYLDFKIGSSGKTTFTAPFAGLHQMISVPVEKDNEFTMSKFSINGKENMLILFPSYLSHYSEPGTDDSYRITLSANLLPSELGTPENLNYVKL